MDVVLTLPQREGEIVQSGLTYWKLFQSALKKPTNQHNNKNHKFLSYLFWFSVICLPQGFSPREKKQPCATNVKQGIIFKQTSPF